MSVIFLSDDFPPSIGGIQTYSCELARAVGALGEEVAVVASRQEGGEQFDEQLPFEVVRVSMEGGHPIAAINFSTGVGQIVQRLNTPPRCLLAMKWSPEGPGAILARRDLRCPMVLMGHGGEFRRADGSPLKWLVQRVVLRRMALCLANSHYTAGLFEKAGIAEERISIIYGGVRPEQYQVADERAAEVRSEMCPGDAPLLLTASRLVERKGHDTVLEALPRVRERFPNVIWVVTGEGPMQEALVEQAAESGLADSVRFVGRVDDDRLAALYAVADLYVMPSRPIRGKLPEGLGLVYLEAAAAGTPSVATNFGGIPDAIVDGQTGLLVEPDDAGALAEALTELLSDDERRVAMGEAARKRVRAEFTWTRVAERFLEQIDRLEGGEAQ